MRIAENLALGIQLGLTSVGWALWDLSGRHIVDAGVWTFNAPEISKDFTPTNRVRESVRADRRKISRRRQRMNAIRELLVTAGLLTHPGKGVVAEQMVVTGASPWFFYALRP